MSYLVLARKWRPRSFEELVGQEHVVRALTNALDSGRVHHAFLFTGTRGVGKTTIARILAKALNCETGVRSRPCGICGACREIDEGRFVDLIEVDAASRTKVEDTRELLENVQYAPSRGRYKVYLIDEVHMLSGHSFNALLKTLEEPPPHVKFLLATTDPQKLPATVLSRCLQFHLKRLAPTLIAERLAMILAAESVGFEAPALTLLARAADGSLRDALSLLDQALAFGAGRVSEADVRLMLGTIDRGHVVRLVERLAAGDVVGLIETLRSLDEQVPDYDQVLVELAALLERLALTQLVADSGADGGFDPELLARLAPRLTAEDLQLYYQIALLGRRDLGLAPEPRIGFEMTVLRMLAFRPSPVGASELAPARAPATPAAPARVAPGAAAAVRGPGPVDWQELLTQLELVGAAQQLAANCVWVGREGDVVRLRLDRRSEALRTPGTEERLAQALGRHFGTSVRLIVERDDAGQAPDTPDTPARREARAAEAELAQARAALEADPTVRALRERFGASVQAETVKPVR
ncbi:MAG TPA: DNA polymerase III subunit gamma/tau [Steroidobacteraceae bacterium]|nr:DNA polymerase III subunit gamma/tau [Steroidobacteraceae bacterium]